MEYGIRIENGEIAVPTLFADKELVYSFIEHLLEERELVCEYIDLSILRDATAVEVVTVGKYSVCSTSQDTSAITQPTEVAHPEADKPDSCITRKFDGKEETTLDVATLEQVDDVANLEADTTEVAHLEADTRTATISQDTSAVQPMADTSAITQPTEVAHLEADKPDSCPPPDSVCSISQDTSAVQPMADTSAITDTTEVAHLEADKPDSCITRKFDGKEETTLDVAHIEADTTEVAPAYMLVVDDTDSDSPMLERTPPVEISQIAQPAAVDQPTISATIDISSMKEMREQKTNTRLALEGEVDIFKRLTRLFPKMSVQLTNAIPHVADIHMVDDNGRITFVFEVKNKISLTREDVDKFERDLENVRSMTDYRVVGIFVSIRSSIPRHGVCQVYNDRCYLGSGYISDSNLQLIVNVYRTMLKPQKSQDTTKVEYAVPDNVTRLLAELKNEYATIEDTRSIYLEQIRLNDESNKRMHDLLLKLELQKRFIRLINQEFIDIVSDDVVQETIRASEEEKLTRWLNERTKTSIKKRDVVAAFPQVPELNAMKLQDIINKYRHPL